MIRPEEIQVTEVTNDAGEVVQVNIMGIAVNADYDLVQPLPSQETNEQ